MKSTVKIIFVICILASLSLLTLRVSASGEERTSTSSGEYLLSEVVEGYMLSIRTASGSSPVMSSENIGELVDYIESNGGERLVFLGVSLSEEIVLSKSLTLSGTLNTSGGITVAGGDVTFSELKLTLSSKSVRIKGGTLTVKGCEIYASGVAAFLLDYSSSARLDIPTGIVEVKDAECAVELLSGTVCISGGAVRCDGSAAIKNRATLILSGAAELVGTEWDVITDKPIFLGGGEEPLQVKTKVKYEKSFERGTVFAAFYNASADSLASIELYDSFGNGVPLKYFESHYKLGERCVGAAYLPFKYNYYSDGVQVFTEELLLGERASGFDGIERVGYTHSGWATKSPLGEQYDFLLGAASDLDLFATFKLNEPTFTLSSLEFTFDRAEHILSVKNLSHPLLENATVNYVWYRDGAQISYTGEGIALKQVKDSGKYKCKVIFTFGKDSVSVESPYVSVKVNKALVALPEILPKEYSGKLELPELYTTSLYTVSTSGGCIVGIYPVTLTLVDSENYSFENTEGDSVCLDFEIKRATNYFVDPIKAFDYYETIPSSPSALSRFGDVVFLYSSTADFGYSEQIPNTPGKYYVMAYVPESENYYGLYSEPLCFEIFAERAVGVSIQKMPTRVEYSSFDLFDPTGLVLTVTYNSSRTESVYPDSLDIAYQSGDSLRFGDGGVIAKYSGLSIVIPISVSKAEYDISNITFVSSSAVYNAAYQTLSFGGTLPTGLDGIPLFATVSGGGIGVGRYTVTLTFSSESDEYTIPKSITSVLEITPLPREVFWESKSFVYDGALKVPSAYFIDVYGRKCYLSVSGERSLAGKHTATAALADANYALLGTSCEYEILKADYDFSSVRWSGSEFVYDGEEKGVTLVGLPSGVSVLVYTNNKATDAGCYTAEVTLAYDSANYNPPPKISCEWEILLAEYDLSGFEFINAQWEYSGSVQYPHLSGALPVGADGIALEYRYLGGATHVSEGEVFVEIELFSSSKNYKTPPRMRASVKILPKGISVSWSSLEFTYDTRSHLPTAYAEECEVKVLGNATSAGDYTALAVSMNSDYYVINETVSFVIKRAENAWTSALKIENFFENRLPNPAATALSGAVEFIYSLDREGLSLIDAPTEVGEYYVFAYAVGDENYLPLISEPVPFEIYEVLPVGISVSLNKDTLTALEKLSCGDITVTVTNNDGTSYTLDASGVDVAYQNADSLRYGDTELTVSCLGFSEVVKVRVKKADFDMSGVGWGVFEYIYDGSEKSIVLSGLPEGIRVLSYVGGRGVGAGEYPVFAEIEYDKQNYNPPIIPEGVLIIKKQLIELPTLSPLVYNGELQAPDITGSPLYTFDIEYGKGAGSYSVSFTLTDKENYELSSNTLYYEIKPIEISILLGDVNKYLFEKLADPTVEIISGELIDGDSLMLSFVYENGKVSCISSNPNYKITVTEGRIIEVDKLSEEGFRRAFSGFLILICLLLLTLGIVLRRREVVRCVISVKERVFKKNQEITPTVISGAQEHVSDEATCEVDTEEVPIIEGEEIESVLSVDAAYADSLITNSLAKSLVKRGEEVVITEGKRKRIINVDTLSRNFSAGETVDVNILKERSLLPEDTAYVKVLARGSIDKPLRVLANDFSLSAVKMIALTGGEAVRVTTKKGE